MPGILVFRHRFDVDNVFESNEEVLSFNNPESTYDDERFSVLDQIDHLRTSEDEPFTFTLEYDTGTVLIWRQSSNPTDAKVVTGLQSLLQIVAFKDEEDDSESKKKSTKPLKK